MLIEAVDGVPHLGDVLSQDIGHPALAGMPQAPDDVGLGGQADGRMLVDELPDGTATPGPLDHFVVRVCAVAGKFVPLRQQSLHSAILIAQEVQCVLVAATLHLALHRRLPTA